MLAPAIAALNINLDGTWQQIEKNKNRRIPQPNIKQFLISI